MSKQQDRRVPSEAMKLPHANLKTRRIIETENTLLASLYKAAIEQQDNGLEQLPGNNQAIWGELKTAFDNENKTSIEKSVTPLEIQGMLKRSTDHATDDEGKLLPNAFRDILAQTNSLPTDKKKEILVHLGYSVKHLPVDQRVNAFYGIFDQACTIKDYNLNFALACAVRSLPEDHKSQIKALLIQNLHDPA